MHKEELHAAVEKYSTELEELEHKVEAMGESSRTMVRQKIDEMRALMADWKVSAEHEWDSFATRADQLMQTLKEKISENEEH